MRDRLLDLLQQRANHRGQVVARAAWLQDELDCSFEDVAVALNLLVSEGQLEVLSPLPWLIAKVQMPGRALAHREHSWSGSSPARVHSEQQISREAADAYIEVPVSSAAAAATQQREVGGAGEGEALLEHVLAVLGPEADRDEFRAILAGHDPALIDRCLKRVLVTKSIRVSRAALFRSLLAKLKH